MSACELSLWRRQARAIGRSSTHLGTIEKLLQQIQDRQSSYLDVSLKTYRVRQIDLEEFNQKALELMEASSPLKSLPSKQLQPLVQQLKQQWRQFKHFLERIGLKVLNWIEANSPHKWFTKHFSTNAQAKLKRVWRH